MCKELHAAPVHQLTGDRLWGVGARRRWVIASCVLGARCTGRAGRMVCSEAEGVCQALGRCQAMGFCWAQGVF